MGFQLRDWGHYNEWDQFNLISEMQDKSMKSNVPKLRLFEGLPASAAGIQKVMDEKYIERNQQEKWEGAGVKEWQFEQGHRRW